MSKTEPKITRKKIYDYQPHEENANAGTERGTAMVEDSYRNYGAGRSLLADKNGVLIAGNKSQQGAINAGIEDVIEIEVDGNTQVVVKRIDLDFADDPDNKAKYLAYVDNRAAQISLKWDIDRLRADAEKGINLRGMFTELELARMGINSKAPSQINDIHPQMQNAQKLQKHFDAQPGDLWVAYDPDNPEIKHRLFIGDSTDPDTPQKLFDGAKPRLMITDPPYGVSYDATWREVYENAPRTAVNAVKNDDNASWSAVFLNSPCDVLYCWHASLNAHILAQDLIKSDWGIRAVIIWVKHHFVFSQGHYHWQHEPCYYAVKKGAKADFVGARNQSTVWQFSNLDAIGGSDEIATGHATQKPLEAMLKPMANHLGDVYDPFVGSGTTIVAAHNLGRNSYSCEIVPEYAAITLKRLVDLGLEVSKL